MHIYPKYLLLALCIWMYAAASFGNDGTNFGLKGGANLSRINYIEGYTYYRVEDFSYPAGLGFGIYYDSFNYRNLTITHEALIQSNNVKMRIINETGDILDETIGIIKINFPTLVRYEFSQSALPYLVSGFTLGYTIRGRYSAYYVFYDNRVEKQRDITQELPTFTTSIEFGIGKTIEITGKGYRIDLRGQYWLSSPKLPFTPEWHLIALQLAVGVNL